ncbi:MAG TPA: YceH family protein [Pyrinomonadaceae bacterium]
MNPILNDVEARVVGSLIEKQVTTPDYYPLTLNALVNACNQIQNRDPVVSYDERTVAAALESLREKNLVYVFYGSDSRVPKYKHVVPEIFHLTPPEVAVLCVLLLRGPQTLGEVRGRTGRFHEFADLAEVEATLDSLARKDPPLVSRLARAAGQKDARYAHLLSGEPPTVDELKPPPASPRAARGDGERLARLETEVESLRGEVSELRRQLDEFRKQFE